jgi:hypothetical protein
VRDPRLPGKGKGAPSSEGKVKKKK